VRRIPAFTNRATSEQFGRQLERLVARKAAREGPDQEDGVSTRSSNHIAAACRQFVRWAVEHGLASGDPLATLRPVSARLDRRRERRALSQDDE